MTRRCGRPLAQEARRLAASNTPRHSWRGSHPVQATAMTSMTTASLLSPAPAGCCTHREPTRHDSWPSSPRAACLRPITAAQLPKAGLWCDAMHGTAARTVANIGRANAQLAHRLLLLALSNLDAQAALSSLSSLMRCTSARRTCRRARCRAPVLGQARLVEHPPTARATAAFRIPDEPAAASVLASLHSLSSYPASR